MVSIFLTLVLVWRRDGMNWDSTSDYMAGSETWKPTWRVISFLIGCLSICPCGYGWLAGQLGDLDL